MWSGNARLRTARAGGFVSGGFAAGAAARFRQAVFDHFTEEGIAMNAEAFAGLRLIPGARLQRALDHPGLEDFDGLLKKDIPRKEMFHQPVKFFFHFLSLDLFLY